MNNFRLFISFSQTKKFPECDYEMKSLIRRAILATLDYEGFDYDTEVSVTFCDNQHIKELNKEYRNKDSATDVLSFPMYDLDELDQEIEIDDSVCIGDIVISLERAAEQAKELGHSLKREVAFLVIHSTLHLLGYDHELSKDDEEAQCLAQREIVEILGI